MKKLTDERANSDSLDCKKVGILRMPLMNVRLKSIHLFAPFVCHSVWPSVCLSVDLFVCLSADRLYFNRFSPILSSMGLRKMLQINPDNKSWNKQMTPTLEELYYRKNYSIFSRIKQKLMPKTQRWLRHMAIGEKNNWERTWPFFSCPFSWT